MNSITRRTLTLRTFKGLARLSFLLLFTTFAGVSQAPAQVAVGVSITVAPPVLPVYDQPPLPGPGYIWTPGYWAWSDDGDYYWVPGTWVEPPAVGLLWTPGYWACNDDGIYVWNAGYWGPHIGFYGGVNYGWGYGGVGYGGGFWRNGVFSYNRTVNHFGSVHITNIYSKTVIVNNNHVSFNGGSGGLTSKPNPQEMAAAKENHTPPTGVQTQHQQQASTNRDLRASVNGGNPKIAAVSQAGHFDGPGVTGTHQHDTGPGGGVHANTAVHNNSAGHGTGGGNTPKPGNASLNQPHANQNHTVHQNTGGNAGGKPQPPRTLATNVNRNPPRAPAPRGPAPRRPPPHGNEHH
jgi:hypothetical protein